MLYVRPSVFLLTKIYSVFTPNYFQKRYEVHKYWWASHQIYVMICFPKRLFLITGQVMVILRNYVTCWLSGVSAFRCQSHECHFHFWKRISTHYKIIFYIIIIVATWHYVKSILTLMTLTPMTPTSHKSQTAKESDRAFLRAYFAL